VASAGFSSVVSKYFGGDTALQSPISPCEKYAYPSKLKEWTQRHVEYSESLMMTVQDGYLDKQRPQKLLQ
jgi:hypothetical protein